MIHIQVFSVWTFIASLVEKDTELHKEEEETPELEQLTELIKKKLLNGLKLNLKEQFIDEAY